MPRNNKDAEQNEASFGVETMTLEAETKACKELSHLEFLEALAKGGRKLALEVMALADYEEASVRKKANLARDGMALAKGYAGLVTTIDRLRKAQQGESSSNDR